MKLIVGLGNPGEKYSSVRHNLGFMVVDELGSRVQGIGYSWEYQAKFKSEIIRLNSLILAKPQTYMNRSGLAVSMLAKYFKVRPEDIIIIHDELDLPLGKIKIRLGGAAAGHHGVESIIEALGTDQFIRVRLGIGQGGTSPEKFVLQPFMLQEKPKVKHMIKQAVKAIDSLLEKGLNEAQSKFN